MAHKTAHVPRKALVDLNKLMNCDIPVKTAKREITSKYGLEKDVLENYFSELTARHQRANGNN